MFLQRYDDCISICDKMLVASPTDKTTLELRAKAVAGKVSLVEQFSHIKTLHSVQIGFC
jgi:hypothetical protein